MNGKYPKREARPTKPDYDLAIVTNRQQLRDLIDTVWNAATDPAVHTLRPDDIINDWMPDQPTPDQTTGRPEPDYRLEELLAKLVGTAAEKWNRGAGAQPREVKTAIEDVLAHVYGEPWRTIHAQRRAAEPSEPELEDPNSHIGAPTGPPAHPQACICANCEPGRAVNVTALQPTEDKELSPVESRGAEPGPSL